MAEMNDIVKLAVDAYHGSVEKYSSREATDTLRQALIEANNGSTKVDYRAIRDGKCNGLFAIIETILANTVVEGLTGDEFFMNLVDFRNVAEGDQNEFVVENNDLFVVAKAADGTQGIRRQRLDGVDTTIIPTEMRIVRIYEELNRILAGRVDFNHMIDKVGESYRRQMLNDIYSLWTSAATATKLGPTYAVGGSYDEGKMLDLIEHVEAASGGKKATIIGTKKALRNLRESVQSDGAKEELHNMGYYGNFFGTACMAIPQRHKVGTTAFVLNDNMLTVIAGDDKPIKFVWEGDPLVIPHDAIENADLTQEYVYGQKYGAGILLANGNSGIGQYIIGS